MKKRDGILSVIVHVSFVAVVFPVFFLLLNTVVCKQLMAAKAR